MVAHSKFLEAQDLNAYGPRLDTRGLQVAPRLTRRILVEAKHSAHFAQEVYVMSTVADARHNSQSTEAVHGIFVPLRLG